MVLRSPLETTVRLLRAPRSRGTGLQQIVLDNRARNHCSAAVAARCLNRFNSTTEPLQLRMLHESLSYPRNCRGDLDEHVAGTENVSDRLPPWLIDNVGVCAPSSVESRGNRSSNIVSDEGDRRRRWPCIVGRHESAGVIEVCLGEFERDECQCGGSSLDFSVVALVGDEAPLEAKGRFEKADRLSDIIHVEDRVSE